MCDTHSAIALSLIALASGIFISSWAKKNETSCKKVSCFFGGFIVVVALLQLVCLGYKTIKAYKDDCKSCHESQKMDRPMGMMPFMMNHGMGNMKHPALGNKKAIDVKEDGAENNQESKKETE